MHEWVEFFRCARNLADICFEISVLVFVLDVYFSVCEEPVRLSVSSALIEDV